MGPGSRSSDRSDLPTYPRFTWSATKVPWTDGTGPQLRYEEAVKHRGKFHDMLADTNTNKLKPEMRGIMLMQGLFGRARDLIRSIPEKEIYSVNGPKRIVSVINKQDSLAKLTTFFSDFLTIVQMKRGDNEAFKNFEIRFAATASKFKQNHEAPNIPEPLLACLLLHATQLEDHQKISILSSVATQLAPTQAEIAAGSTEEITDVKYESIAKVLRQCERTRPNQPLSANSGHPGNSGSGGRSGRGGGNSGVGTGGGGGGTKRYTPSELRRAKQRHACHLCRSKGIVRYGHWADDHNPDGSLPPGTPSLEQRPTGINTNSATTAEQNKQENAPTGDKQPTPNTQFGFTSTLSASSGASANSSDRILCSSAVTPKSALPCGHIGPLVEYGAPWSAIGEVELKLVSAHLIVPTPKLEPKPSELAKFDQWQYGEGDHASRPKRILVSVTIFVRTDGEQHVTIRHLLIQGSSSWVIGPNITRRCTLEYIERNAIRLPMQPVDYITMVDDSFHSRIPFARFTPKSASPSSPALASLAAPPSTSVAVQHDWSYTRRVIDRVHKHVCGHASFSDIRTLLIRNNFWSNEAQECLVQTITNCQDCKVSSTPPPNRRVSITSLDRAFNDVIAIDHFYLDDVILMHIMATSTRFSSALVVPSTIMRDAIYTLEAAWFSQFWPPNAIHAYGAFQNAEFSKFLSLYDISLRPVSPRRHEKNMCEPRHGVIRSIFLRLQRSAADTHPATTAIRAIKISNNLYGNDTASAFELTKGFTRPILQTADIQPLPDDIRQAHLDIAARRKLNLILRSHALVENKIRTGDLVQVFIKLASDKRGVWTAPRQVLSFDQEGGFLTTTGRAGKTIRAAFEDVILAPKSDSLDDMIQQAADDLDERLAKLMSADSTDDQLTDIDDQTDVNVDDDESSSMSPDDDETNSANNPGSSQSAATDPVPSADKPKVESRIQVFWSDDNMYYAGVVGSYNKKGSCHVAYDDGETEDLNLEDEIWRLERIAKAASGSLPLTLPSN